MKKKIYFEDFRSGLVVFLVALPLCLGVALASKAPPMSGLIAGMIGGIVIGSISNSRVSVSGPAAGLTAIMVSSLATLHGKYELLVLAVVFAGIVQLTLGILRAGSISNYIPSAAIKGMLFGIGVILIIKQIPHFFGYDKDPEGDLDFFQVDGENSFSEMINALNFICPPSLIIGCISLAILIVWEMKAIKSNRVLKNVPGPLVVVVVGILGSGLFSSWGGLWVIERIHMVDFPSPYEAKSLSDFFIFPDFANGIKDPLVYKIGLVIAAVASIETLLCIEAVDKLDPERTTTNTNRELIAQGTGNMLSGLIGGLPITSVIVRSSANLNAGAKTKMSTIVHGFLLAITIVAIPGILMMIPNSCLAAILIVTGYKLASIKIIRNAYQQGWKYFLPFAVTIIVMLFTDLLKGVGAGIIVAFVFIIIENMRIPFKVGYQKFNGKNHVLVQVSQHVTFLHKGSFAKLLKNLPENSVLTIDARKTTFMDRDVTELLNEFKQSAKIKKIEVEYLNIKEISVLGH
ncbi:MAG TPA: SulP family inorganic anion transporter [Flavobacteriales bacterium]|nr:SulP family inorganic anion transporter [Flavobacteriales bacterium]